MQRGIRVNELWKPGDEPVKQHDIMVIGLRELKTVKLYKALVNNSLLITSICSSPEVSHGVGEDKWLDGCDSVWFLCWRFSCRGNNSAKNILVFCYICRIECNKKGSLEFQLHNAFQHHLGLRRRWRRKGWRSQSWKVAGSPRRCCLRTPTPAQVTAMRQKLL